VNRGYRHRLRAVAGAALVLALAWSVAPAQTDEPFIIEDIRVEGLQRITAGTVFNYMPFQVGDAFDDEGSSLVIRALYQTGLFDDIVLERDGSTLVVIVKERPAIGNIEVSGNKDIKTEELLSALEQLDFAEGRVFDRSQLRRIKQELVRQYFTLGKYAVEVRSEVTELDGNRVAVSIDIFEGKRAKIRQINIVGNRLFEEEELLDEFESGKTGLFSFFSSDDQYSRQKLAGDLETLRSFYLDRGYLRFNISSTQVSISPDKEDIFITINVEEGKQYSIADISMAGNFIVPVEELFDLILVSRGELFSRRAVTASAERITQRLGDEGYAFANVNPVPDINDEDSTVKVSFFVEPGKRVYVRRISFAGNNRTRDEILRREMRQQESSWFSPSKVDRGRIRLQRLGFFSSVDVQTPAVAEADDQVEVRYQVQEAPAGNLLAGIGFSQSRGLVFRTSVTQDNFLGSGNRVSFAFNNSRVDRTFSLGYLNPYYTIDGVARGFDASFRQVDASDANISDYDATVLKGGINFGLPISEYNFLNAGINLERTDIEAGSTANTNVTDFLGDEGSKFNILRFSASLNYDTRNRAILPDRGFRHRVRSELATPFVGESVTFAKFDYRGDLFIPLLEKWTLLLQGDVGYGTGYGSTERLPFFEHFYLGGPRSLRGFEDNTVGRQDAAGNGLGGNLRLFSSTELILPLPFLQELDQFRITAFFDIGNVYDLEEESLDLGLLRYSVGLSSIWISPVGILTVSISSPIGSEPGDRTQGFQFTFGTSF